METMRRHWLVSDSLLNYIGNQPWQRTRNTGLGNANIGSAAIKDALNSFSNGGAYDPLGQKPASSALEIGQTYSMLGDYYRARMTFDEVLDHYPGGPEAALDRKAIEAISLKTGSTPPLSVKNVINITR